MNGNRSFGDTDKAKLLAAMRTFRAELIRAMRTAPIGGDVYKATGPVIDALEGLAGRGDGRLDALSLAPHSSPLKG